ncbi:hypothetical protein Tco_0042965, partial [Tanacetum coccineum]
RDLQLDDEEGTDYLPNATIFEELTRMGAKTTAWNEFSSTMAIAIICLATNQKFNFSKYIFESMVKNLDNAGKLLIYPSLKKRVKKLEKKGGSRAHKLKRLYRVGRSARVVSFKEASLGDQEDASKQGRKIDDIDKDAEITLVNETQRRHDDDIMFDVSDLAVEEVFVAEHEFCQRVKTQRRKIRLFPRKIAQ